MNKVVNRFFYIMLFIFSTVANSANMKDIVDSYNLLSGNKIKNVQIVRSDIDTGESYKTNDECKIFVNKNLSGDTERFIVYHELTHCWQDRKYIYSENQYPIKLSQKEKNIYDKLLHLSLSTANKEGKNGLANPGIVYQEMLADAYGVREIKNEEWVIDFANKRKKDWLRDIPHSNYPNYNVIMRVGINSEEINTTTNEEFSKYLEYMSIYHNFSLQ